MRNVILLFAAVILGGPGLMFGQLLERGLISVYADQLDGRRTASGALYDKGRISAAHASMPFGTMVRVANSETGRFVDAMINDRKGSDGRMIVLSRAAADVVQLPFNAVADGSLTIIGQSAAPANAERPRAATGGGGNAARADSSPAQRKFRPLGDIFGKDKSNENLPANTMASYQQAGPSPQYGIPSGQYQPPLVTQPGIGTAGELMPMNARASDPSRVGPALPPSLPVMMAPASPRAPYRVQFGAYRRTKGADEMAGMLREAGIPVSVFSTTTTGLNVVVSNAGFSSAEEAQRWIDFEGGRRGWSERPVVIR